MDDDVRNRIRGICFIGDTIIGNDLQYQAVWQTYDGFSGFLDPSGVDAGVVATVRIGHFNNSVVDRKCIVSAGSGSDRLRVVFLIQRKRLYRGSVLADLQHQAGAGSRTAGGSRREIDPYGKGDSDQDQNSKKYEITFFEIFLIIWIFIFVIYIETFHESLLFECAVMSCASKTNVAESGWFVKASMTRKMK